MTETAKFTNKQTETILVSSNAEHVSKATAMWNGFMALFDP